MLDHELLLPLREAKGLSQVELAAAVGLRQPALSLIEHGRRSLTPRLAAELERRLALGSPHDVEEGPSFALGEVVGGDVRLLSDADGRIGVFRERVFAEGAARIPQLAGYEVRVVPTWLQGAVDAALDRLGPLTSREQVPEEPVFVVDSAFESDERTRATVAYGNGVFTARAERRRQREAVERSAAALVRDRT